MGLATIFREALDAIKTAHADLAVAVVIGGVSGTGTRDSRTDAADLTVNGEVGVSSSRVRVNADTFAKPANGDAITVGGEKCLVNDVRTDGAGAFYVIEYQVQRPVTFDPDHVL
jgi:hypothetical protein